MCDYISRDAAFDSLNKLCDRVCQYSNAQRYVMCSSCPLGDAFNVIEVDIPAADVRPVVRGHWISREEAEKIFEENYSDFPVGECSVCGHCDWDCTESESFNFCPHCGADMRGEAEHE